MADTTTSNPEIAAPALAEQTPIAEPATTPAAGEAAEDAKPSMDAPKEEVEKSEGTLWSLQGYGCAVLAHRRGRSRYLCNCISTLSSLTARTINHQSTLTISVRREQAGDCPA